jgi:hypothetical protein
MARGRHAQYAGEEAAREAKQKAMREAAKARAEQYERKLIREIEEEEAQEARAALADPPPELSPAERLARENAERLDALEHKGNAQGRLESYRRPLESPEQNRRKEALRTLRNRKHAEREDQRNRKHEKDCAKQIGQLERDTEKADTELASMEQRQAQERADLTAHRNELDGRRQALTRALGPDETTEKRIERVMTCQPH